MYEIEYCYRLMSIARLKIWIGPVTHHLKIKQNPQTIRLSQTIFCKANIFLLFIFSML